MKGDHERFPNLHNFALAPWHALIRDEWLLLASLPVYNRIKPDAELYQPAATLLHERLATVKHHIGQRSASCSFFKIFIQEAVS